MSQQTQIRISSARTVCLSTEFYACFVGFPVLLAILGLGAGVFVWLWFASIICMLWMHRNLGWSPNREWNGAALRPELKRILMRFAPFAIAMFAFTWCHDQERLFDFPQQNPIGWAAIMFFYPMMSVIPQEIIFRSFIHRRYASFFSSRAMLILVSGITFGWVHVVMHNWVAVIFSAIGGFLFADTYERTKSLAATCFEHSLYGCYVFTIGLGWYFYHANGGH